MASDSRFESSESAELAFYEAIERTDLLAMKQVWAGSRAAVCIHPGSAPLRGLGNIMRSWESIFQGGPEMHFRVELLEKVITDDLAIHLVAEYIRLSGDAEERPPVFATNIFRRCQNGWHMTLHHASPTPERRRSGRHSMH